MVTTKDVNCPYCILIIFFFLFFFFFFIFFFFFFFFFFFSQNWPLTFYYSPKVTGKVRLRVSSPWGLICTCTVCTDLSAPIGRVNIIQSNLELYIIQSNIDSSNTDGTFTMANSNSFLSPYEILPIVQENKYLRKFSYLIVKLYVVSTH